MVLDFNIDDAAWLTGVNFTISMPFLDLPLPFLCISLTLSLPFRCQPCDGDRVDELGGVGW